MIRERARKIKQEKQQKKQLKLMDALDEGESVVHSSDDENEEKGGPGIGKKAPSKNKK